MEELVYSLGSARLGAALLLQIAVPSTLLKVGQQRESSSPDVAGQHLQFRARDVLATSGEQRVLPKRAAVQHRWWDFMQLAACQAHVRMCMSLPLSLSAAAVAAIVLPLPLPLPLSPPPPLMVLLVVLKT